MRTRGAELVSAHLDGVALSCHLLFDRRAVEKEIIEDEEVPAPTSGRTTPASRATLRTTSGPTAQSK
jgi:hypothetical protein